MMFRELKSPLAVTDTACCIVPEACFSRRIRLQNVEGSAILIRVHDGDDVSKTNYEIKLSANEVVEIETRCSIWAVTESGTAKVAILVQKMRYPYYG